MKLSRLLYALVLLAGLALATTARADGADPTIFLIDPTCPAGSFCINIVWTGPTTTFGTNGQNPGFGAGDANPPLIFDVANPPGSYPMPPAYNCNSNGIFEVNDPITTNSPSAFLGCLFGDGTLTQGEELTLGSMGGSVTLDLPNDVGCTQDDAPGTCGNGIGTLTAAPEPGTVVLTLIGLALSMVGFSLFDPRKKAATVLQRA